MDEFCISTEFSSVLDEMYCRATIDIFLINFLDNNSKKIGGGEFYILNPSLYEMDEAADSIDEDTYQIVNALRDEDVYEYGLVAILNHASLSNEYKTEEFLQEIVEEIRNHLEFYNVTIIATIPGAYKNGEFVQDSKALKQYKELGFKKTKKRIDKLSCMYIDLPYIE